MNTLKLLINDKQHITEFNLILYFIKIHYQKVKGSKLKQNDFTLQQHSVMM